MRLPGPFGTAREWAWRAVPQQQQREHCAQAERRDERSPNQRGRMRMGELGARSGQQQPAAASSEKREAATSHHQQQHLIGCSEMSIIIPLIAAR